MDIWETISIPLSVIVLFLHLYGIYLLWRVQELSSSKYVLIASFSLSNILFAAHNLIRFLIQRYDTVGYIYLSVIVEGLRIPFYGLMVLLTLERFLEVYLHMKYRNSWFCRNKLSMAVSLWIIFILWAIGSALAVRFTVSPAVLISWISYKISLGLHILIIVQFLIVYAYVYEKMQQHKRMSSVRRRLQPTPSKRKIFVPFFIVVTFIFFDTVPDLMIIFAGQGYRSWILLLFRLDTLFNAFIYLFLQPRIKKRLSKKIRENKVIKFQLQDVTFKSIKASTRSDQSSNSSSLLLKEHADSPGNH